MTKENYTLTLFFFIGDALLFAGYLFTNDAVLAVIFFAFMLFQAFRLLKVKE